MIEKLPLKIILTALSFFMSYLTVSGQVSLREISLNEQIENSSLVVEGKVIAQRSFWDANHSLIYTANTIEVSKVFKGDAVETIEVLTQGGIVGLEAILVSHALKLGKGSLGVFTLYDNNVNISAKNKTKLKQFKTYSSVLGFYKYDLDSDLVINTISKRKGITTSFYSDIVKMTKKKYIQVSQFDVQTLQSKQVQKNSLLAPMNITFTPTTPITAGTGSVLTINGSGFGGTQGKVGFSDSNEGGSTFFDALDTQVLKWTDTQITVEVPSRGGTGNIRVSDWLGINDVSSASLTIDYAQINLPVDPTGLGDPDEAFQTRHYGDNTDTPTPVGFEGGYTWEMYTDFFDDSEFPGAKASFMRAFESWRCETNVNWEVSPSATTTDSRSTSENVIRFDNGTGAPDLEAGVLGTCYSGFEGRRIEGVVYLYVTDIDIVFDNGTSWYFGAPGEVFDEGEFDFETVALHELGHGHQLGHVIDPTNVMHFAIGPNSPNTTLDANSIAGANDVHSRSTDQIPGLPMIPLMTNYAGSCGLSVEDNTLEKSISLYPNPTKHQFFIKSTFVNLDKIEIFDVSGRLVSDIDVSESSRTKTVNLNNTAKGMYFVNIHSEGRYITKKLVLE